MMIFKDLQEETLLIEENKEEVFKRNRKLLETISMASALWWVVLGLLLILTSYGDIQLTRLYLIGGFVCLVLYFITRKLNTYKKVMVFYYLEGTLLFLFSLYLSVVVSPDAMMSCGLMLFILLPICIIDKTVRVIVYIILLGVISCLCSWIAKESAIAIDDIGNVTFACLMGNVVGFVLRNRSLKALEAIKVTQIQKSTDALTGLYNRRKLMEVVAEQNTKIRGILMLDVDNFKLYNDHYGHINGDYCLEQIGIALKKLEDMGTITFYRYGGEEILGICLIQENIQEMQVLAEMVRREIIEHLKIPFSIVPQGVVTVSIGYSYGKYGGYERLVKEADDALYQAKRDGRNVTRGIEL